MAPTHLISDSKSRGKVSLTAVASPASYGVQVYRTKTSLPLNSPKISEPPNNGLAADVGGYSGRKFRSVALAEAGLFTSNGFFARPPRSGLQKVSLGLGVTGQAWIASPGDAVILWNQGGWTLEVNSEPLVMLHMPAGSWNTCTGIRCRIMTGSLRYRTLVTANIRWSAGAKGAMYILSATTMWRARIRHGPSHAPVAAVDASLATGAERRETHDPRVLTNCKKLRHPHFPGRSSASQCPSWCKRLRFTAAASMRLHPV